LDDAIASHKKAIELNPKFANVHGALGDALRDKGQLDEAIASYKKAIELNLKFAPYHSNMGIALARKGQLDEAIECYKRAIELDPKLALARLNLGIELAGKGQLNEAIACFNKAIELDPKLANAHGALGDALLDKGQLDEAIACYNKAIELNPKLTLARSRLAQAQRLAAFQCKLAALRKGNFKPSTHDERLGLSELCIIKKLYRTAARLYADTFAADPKLADDLTAGHRYNAACYAALAAAGHGEDAAKLDAKERERLRKQALDWLRADLTLHTKHLESGQAADRAQVRQQMMHWQQDSDLAAIRDVAALAKLPADERQACEKLWADVAALLKKAREVTK
jgi:tetratricopeptide (TPR) repeat protein